MLKENWRSIARIERLSDNVIIIAAFFVAYSGRSSLLFWDQVLGLGVPFGGPALAPLKDYFIVLVISLLGYSVALDSLGAYGSMRMRSSLYLLWISVLSSCIVFILLAATLYLFKIDLSRSFIGLFCVITALSLAAERFLVFNFLKYWRRKGRNFRNVIICGTGEQAIRLACEITSRPELGLGIRAFGELREESAVPQSEIALFRHHIEDRAGIRAFRLLWGREAIQRALQDYAIDEVLFTDVVDVMRLCMDLITVCSEQGVRTTIAADLLSLGMVKSGISYFGDIPLIHFQNTPSDSWALLLKRLFDVGLSAFLLILLSPFFLLIAGLVKATSRGPVMFRQKRMGLNGRIFTLYKFRSMYADAEKLKEGLLAKNEMKGPAFKLRNDPRVTPVGRGLRRFSIDELPQLWNVLRGDMSLVGPRPPVPGEVSLYERRDRRRLSMRPGLTCIWQVSGRSNISDFDSWVKLDLEYIDNWSLGRDILLLLRTIPAVLFGAGAR